MSTSLINVTGSFDKSHERQPGLITYPLTNTRFLSASDAYVIGNLNARRLEERNRYNRVLLGEALKTEVGESAVAGNLTATPPSWTQHRAGVNHAFVSLPFSSSRHEEVLGAYLSGAAALETTAVPATSSVYFVKGRRAQTITYKLSASSILGTFVAGKGNTISASTSSPKIFRVNVNTPGKITGLRVWVEIVHDSSSGDNSTNNRTRPLAYLGVALRSPNIKFKNAHPIYNSDRLPLEAFSAGDNSQVAGDHDFWSNSYLLWEGLGIHGGRAWPATGGGSASADLECVSWDKDRHMRTIFDDSSNVCPPRLLDSLVAYGGYALGVDQISQGSPNGLSGWGNDYPWITDVNVTGSYSGAGSPPAGWLTGPGGTANTNEYPTTGSNLGTNNIRPVYPILDDVEQVKFNYSEFDTDNDALGWAPREGFRGIRPGLRGTEMSGTWEFLISDRDGIGGGTPIYSTAYFRQVRLEFFYDESDSVKEPLINQFGRRRIYKRVTNVHSKPGSQRVGVMFGTGRNDTNPSSIAYDWNRGGINYSFVLIPEEYGRSYGITSNTSSFGEYAVFSRLTGGLADYLTGSVHAHARYRYLNNEFGTPLIPLNSGSFETAGNQTLIQQELEDNREVITSIINPKRTVAAYQTLRSLLSKNDNSKTADMLISTKLTGST